MDEYDKIADWYATNRSLEAGIPGVSECVRAFPPGSKILDLGCGTGIPILQFLLRSGFGVFGIDSSK